MESIERAVLRLLRDRLGSYTFHEPLLEEKADALLRAGDHIIVVEATVSSRPGVPFGTADVDRVLTQWRSVQRDLRVLFGDRPAKLALLTNRLFSDRVHSLLTGRQIQVYSFDKHPNVAIDRLKDCLDQLAQRAQAKPWRPVDQWTPHELRMVMHATTPNEAFRQLVRIAGLPTPNDADQLLTSVRQVLEGSGMENIPDTVADLYGFMVAEWPRLELRQAQRRALVSILESSDSTAQQLALLRELVQANQLPPGVAHEAQAIIQSKDALIRHAASEVERLLAERSVPDPSLLANLDNTVAGVKSAIEALASSLQQQAYGSEKHTHS